MSITVRASTLADAQSMQLMMSEPAVYAQTLREPFGSLSFWQKRLQDADENEHVHSMVAECDGEFAGHAILVREKNVRRSHVAMLGISVKTHYQRRGIGRRLLQELVNLADNWLNIRRIELTVFVDNTGAIALYESCGFVVEGRAVGFALRNGEYMDALMMARIKPGHV